MTNARRLLLGAASVLVASVAVAVTLALPAAASPPARPASPALATQATGTQAGRIRHVVIVGISGLRWSQVTPSAAPALWRLAAGGSVGDLVDYAQRPLACPADAWLTLNSGARAAAPPPASGGSCTPLPAVASSTVVSSAVASSAVGVAATIPAMPRLVAYNARFHENPDWGLLGRLTPCATAVGPGAALALAAPDGAVPGYVPSPQQVTAPLLARCPLTVIDLGQDPFAERIFASAANRSLSRISAELPPATLLLITGLGSAMPAAAQSEMSGAQTAPDISDIYPDRRITGIASPDAAGDGAGRPHLLATVISGPGYASGMLTAASTRQPGIVTLTDLTPTVAHWLGRSVPGYLAGSVITRADRGSLAAAVGALIARDTAEQVWISTHDWFFAGYAALDVLLLGVPALVFWGASERNRRRRAACWSVTGVIAASVPAGTFLAGLALWPGESPWPGQSPSSVQLYGICAAWTAVVAGLAFAGNWWRRGPLTPAGIVCLITLGVLGADVMSGSRLQLETPFGLSLLESGRYYGIGNDAVGVYCVAALVSAGLAALLVLGGRPPQTPPKTLRGNSSRVGNRAEAGGLRPPRLRTISVRTAHGTPGAGRCRWLGLEMPVLRRFRGSRRAAVLLAGAVGVFAVVASGWPGFGAKVGGTIAMVPCFVLLLLALAGVRPRWRYAVPAALSGVALVAVFALVSYLVPAAGVSDIGAFFGNLLHGHGEALLERKASSNLGTLTASALSPLVPVGVVLTGLALWRPSWFRLRTLALAFESSPWPSPDPESEPAPEPARKPAPDPAREAALVPVLKVPVIRILAWLVWLVLVLGWIADDAGVIVPAVAAPFAVPLLISLASSVSNARVDTSYRGSAVVGSSVAGQTVILRFRKERVQYQLSRLTVGPVLYSLALGRPKVTGLEYVPETGPAILASNHLSVIDSFYLPYVIPRPVVFPAKAEYFEPKNIVGRLFAAYLKSTNQLPIDRGGARSAYATLDAVVEILNRGDLFGFYPEGTRSPDGRLYRGRSGIGYLALQSGAPVVPVAMVGTRKMMPPGSKLPRPSRIEIRFGKPLEFGHLAGDPPGKARRIVAEQVIAAIGELSGQEYVHEYASDVKARLAAAEEAAAKKERDHIDGP